MSYSRTIAAAMLLCLLLACTVQARPPLGLVSSAGPLASHHHQMRRLHTFIGSGWSRPQVSTGAAIGFESGGASRQQQAATGGIEGAVAAMDEDAESTREGQQQP